jgi:hypothetical protein
MSDISQLLFFLPQIKNKPHDGTTIHAFILDPGMVKNSNTSGEELALSQSSEVLVLYSRP